MGGAILVGLAVGAGPTLWSRATADNPFKPSAIATQTMLDEQPSVDDNVWAARSVDDGSGASAGSRVSFGMCHTGDSTNCVVDGDMIWMAGQNIRIADIDAPETHDYRCAREKALGDRATQRLHQLVNGGAVTLQSVDRDEDTYGRKLRLVMVNGTSVGDTLVSEGLARYYRGGKQPWC